MFIRGTSGFNMDIHAGTPRRGNLHRGIIHYKLEIIVLYIVLRMLRELLCNVVNPMP